MSKGQAAEDKTIRARLQSRLAVVARFRLRKDERSLPRAMVEQLDGLLQPPGRETRFLAPPPGFSRNWRMYQPEPKRAHEDLAHAA